MPQLQDILLAADIHRGCHSGAGKLICPVSTLYAVIQLFIGKVRQEGAQHGLGPVNVGHLHHFPYRVHRKVRQFHRHKQAALLADSLGNSLGSGYTDLVVSC